MRQLLDCAMIVVILLFLLHSYPDIEPHAIWTICFTLGGAYRGSDLQFSASSFLVSPPSLLSLWHCVV